MRPIFMSAFSVSVLLSACGGASNPFDFGPETPTGSINASEVASRLSAFEMQRERIEALPVTLEDATLLRGGGSFAGSAALTVTPSGSAAMTYVGDATLDVDFDKGSVFLQMDDFTGTNADDVSQRLAGEIVMQDAAVGLNNDGQFAGLYSGQLRGEGFALDTSGTLTGAFRATPIEAASFSGSDGDATFNGSSAIAVLTGIAE